MILDALVVENVIGEYERAIVGKIVELADLVAGIGLDSVDLGELDVALFTLGRGLLARAEHLALYAVFVVLARQWTRLSQRFSIKVGFILLSYFKIATHFA